MKVTTRFAPSPTGYLHIGGVRTALFNYIFAKKFNGSFLVRIEDTDKERSKTEYIEAIMKGLDWIGLNPDQQPIKQSERFNVYKEEALRLVNSIPNMTPAKQRGKPVSVTFTLPINFSLQ